MSQHPTIPGMPSLDDLGDDALVRLLAAHPPLSPAAAVALLAALDKLLAQFAREGRLTRWAVASEADGAVVVIAWEGPPISGCSHDKLAQVLARHEESSGASVLAAPPILIEVAGKPRALDRAALKALVAAGQAGPSSTHWDLRVGTLGEWRRRGRRPAGETWLAPLLQPQPGR
jgi:hypothetical protein